MSLPSSASIGASSQLKKLCSILSNSESNDQRIVMKQLFKKRVFIDFVLKEWILIISGVGMALTSFLTMRLPRFSQEEMEVLLILFALFVTVQGLHTT